MGSDRRPTSVSHEPAISRLCDTASRSALRHVHQSGTPLLNRRTVSQILDLCRAALFPGFFGSQLSAPSLTEHVIRSNCQSLMPLLVDQIFAALVICTDSVPERLSNKAQDLASRFIDRLPDLRDLLATDVEALYCGDPAATSVEEVIYCYPGLTAITNYRVAHELLLLGVPVLPRLISEMAHSMTGIDIHPGATIGHHFAIDHGTGVVIGATAIIGNNVKLYQGVTLGARSFERDEAGNPVKGVPRHPVIGNNVVIYSNATVLGHITVGDGAVIGGNLWLTRDVAKGEKVVQAVSREAANEMLT